MRLHSVPAKTGLVTERRWWLSRGPLGKVRLIAAAVLLLPTKKAQVLVFAENALYRCTLAPYIKLKVLGNCKFIAEAFQKKADAKRLKSRLRPSRSARPGIENCLRESGHSSSEAVGGSGRRVRDVALLGKVFLMKQCNSQESQLFYIDAVDYSNEMAEYKESTLIM
ncbi:hypothetical protein TYRP_016957 [Tyrophagus putrescentiae]|nr:hypothetical protein TYRP_016957 [Tyrophagus putrescentiae]